MTADDALPQEPSDETWHAWSDQFISWADYTGKSMAGVSDIDDALVMQLEEAAVEEASDQDVERALRQTDVAAAKQAHKMRKRFFRFVVRSVVSTLVATGAIMGAYVVSQWGDLDAAVMVAFFSAVVVQVLGLAYIIARYLFAPRGYGLTGPGPEPAPGTPGTNVNAA